MNMRQNIGKCFRKYQQTINVVLIVGLSGIVYFYHPASYFRFTISVVLLEIVLLYFTQLPVWRTSVLCGLAISLFRNAVFLHDSSYNLTLTLWYFVHVASYYVYFGFFFKVFRIRSHTNNLLALLLLLTATDLLSNSIQLTYRPDPLASDIRIVIISMTAMALLRSVLALFGYYAVKRYHAFVLAEEQLARYMELTLLLTAKLKTELFYLKKSSQDIEHVMERSYWLYRQLDDRQNDPAARQAMKATSLAVAKDIHEIKKDYRRVIAGVEKILESSVLEKGMPLAEIFQIIEQSTRRYVSSLKNKKVNIVFQHTADFTTDKHYSLVTILDNLVANAIDACGETGDIFVKQYSEGPNIILTVTDNGCGIRERDRDYVFDAGFSTKFSPDTGAMSTGLGLAHAKSLTEALGGSITFTSEPGSGTCFKVVIPEASLAPGR